jgi:hypothetical protein
MADIYAIFGTLLVLGITYPGLLATWWLLLPELVEQTRERISQAPRKSFGMGLAAALVASIPAIIFFVLPSQFFQILGWIWLIIAFGIASIGAAGLAAEIGLRINWKSNGEFQSPGAFLRGAVILELASAFPIIGWLLIIPVGTIASLGAAAFVILRRTPKLEPAKKVA